MKLIHNVFAASLLAAVSVAACSSQQGPAVGQPGSGSQVGINGGEHGATGSVGMHLTIGNGVHVNALNWSISNGMGTPTTGTVFITDDAGNEAQSIEFVAGGILAGSGYVITLSGSDSVGDPCIGTSTPVTVMAGATSAAVVVVTCTAPTDASLATTVDSGNIAVDAGVILVSQNPFVCPGITGVSISPAELLPPETAGLTAGVTGSSGGTQTLVWSTSCAGANITNPTSPNATFACGSTTPGTSCQVTLTVGLNGTGADGGSVGQVCTGVGVSTTTETIVCEAGGAFQCFAPTPNLCGTNTCVNFQTDVNHCGNCTTVCATGDTCTAGVCAAPPPTACTTSPCAANGANSVQCTGNTKHGGVCTATEAIIVNRDIGKNLVSAGQLTPTSCYECLFGAGCIDDDKNSDTGAECGDLSGTVGSGNQASETQTQACLNTLTCVFGSDCQNAVGQNPGATDGIGNCFCGSNDVTSSLCAAAPTIAAGPAASAPNGSCAQTELDGFGDTTSTANTPVLANFTTNTTGSGMANNIFACAGSNTGTFACPNCF